MNSFAPDQTLPKNPAIAMDSSGNFVVIFSSYGGGGDQDIWAERYDSSGVRQFNETLVNTFTTGKQDHAKVAMDSAGDFVVVWTSYYGGQAGEDTDGNGGASQGGIFAQLFDHTGAPKGGEIHVNTFTTNAQITPDVAMDSAGNFVVTWSGYGADDAGGDGIYAQRFNNTGAAQGTEFLVNQVTLNNQVDPSIGMDSAGNFVIAWTNPLIDSSSTDIDARQFAANGTPQGNQFTVNSFTTGFQLQPSVALNNTTGSTGDFVIVWNDFRPDLDFDGGIFGQLYDSSGVKQGSEFQVNTFTTNLQDHPSVAMDKNGDFAVTWESYNQSSSFSDFDIYAQAFTNDGNQLNAEFQVNTTTGRAQKTPGIAMDTAGDFVVIWETQEALPSHLTDISGQRYQSNSTTSVSVAATVTAAAEAGPVIGTYTFTRATGDTSQDLIVNFSWSGTATYGSTSDFVFTDANDNVVLVNSGNNTGTFTIPAGQASAVMKLVPVDDDFVENPETVVVKVATGAGYDAVNNPSTRPTVTITSDDVQGLLVTPLTVPVPEGGTQSFSVRLNARPVSNVSVSITRGQNNDPDLHISKNLLSFNGTNWNVPQNVVITADEDADTINGTAKFTVTSNGLTSQVVNASEIDNDLPPGPPPSAPDLSAATDTGVSNTDNITSLDNSTPGKALTFTVANTVSGATVFVYADGHLIGSAVASGTTTTVTTSGGFDLTDGTHQITATQQEVQKGESASSAALTLTVNTSQPAMTISRLSGQQSPTSSSPITFVALFSEVVTDFATGDVVLSGTAGATTALVSGSGKTYIITVSGMTQSGTVVVTVPAGAAHTLAGAASPASINLTNSVVYTGGAQSPATFATLTNGLLLVNGSASNDAINLQLQGQIITVTMNGSVLAFNYPDVTKIQVYANDGNDVVNIGHGIMGTYVLGGYGNDCLVGGDGNDSLTGAAGKDTLIGNAGDDNLNGGKHANRIIGGAGNDRLYGGDAVDYLEGDDGNDRAYGGGSNDTILGGNGNDTLYGDDGNDFIDGGNQSDHLFGGTGNDTIQGGKGNDIIADLDGFIDSLNGGDGTDSAQADVTDILKSIENVL